jgi:hypothetical protein
MPMKNHQEKVDAQTRKLIDQWQGGTAAIWAYTVSHKGLVIRVIAKGRSGNLHLNCGDCEYICGPVKWENCWFELNQQTTGGGEPYYVLRDERNNFLVHCGLIEAKQNVKPIY